MVGDANVASGYQSLYSNSIGSFNIATGFQSMYSNTEGSHNVGIGYQSLFSNITGLRNTAIGYRSLYSNNYGSKNTSFGDQSLFSNQSGDSNTAMGTSSMASSTGENNSALGISSLPLNDGNFNIVIGGFTLKGAFTSDGNTAVGYSAGLTYNNGNDNTFIGTSSGATLDAITNATALGNFAKVWTSNAMRFGNSNVTDWGFEANTLPGQAFTIGTSASNGNGAYLSDGGVWWNASDRNLKSDVTAMSGDQLLDKLQQLKISKWKYKGTEEYHIGPMAQDFYRLFEVGIDDRHISTVDPAGVALLAIQELIKKVETVRGRSDRIPEWRVI